MFSSAQIRIQEATDVAEARRVALRLASGVDFDDETAGRVGIVVTEAGKNLRKHAGGGQMVLRVIQPAGSTGIEMLALDKGPGIADVTRCFQDGYSTAGTAGTGLGAIARLSTVHDIYSRPAQGSALVAQIWKRSATTPAPASHAFQTGGVSVPLAGETVCGDAWIVQERAQGLRITVADGLGHGPLASEAAQLAILSARDRPNGSNPALLERIHAALRVTRGAAVAVAEIDSPSRTLRFAGLGNISGVVVPEFGPVKRCVSSAGTAGLQARTIGEFTYPWTARSLLVMFSDGLQSHWSLDPYPGLVDRHPSLIAGLLYRDYARGRDDVTVVVAREVKPS